MGSHRVGHDWSDLAATAAYWEIFPGGSDGKESSLGWEDPLEKGVETHPSILAWRFPWTEEPGGLQSIGSQRVWHNWATNFPTFPLVFYYSFVSEILEFNFSACLQIFILTAFILMNIILLLLWTQLPILRTFLVYKLLSKTVVFNHAAML